MIFMFQTDSFYEKQVSQDSKAMWNRNELACYAIVNICSWFPIRKTVEETTVTNTSCLLQLHSLSILEISCTLCKTHIIWLFCRILGVPIGRISSGYQFRHFLPTNASLSSNDDFLPSYRTLKSKNYLPTYSWQYQFPTYLPNVLSYLSAYGPWGQGRYLPKSCSRRRGSSRTPAILLRSKAMPMPRSVCNVRL